MIDPQSRSLEWIEQAGAQIANIADTALVEKALRGWTSENTSGNLAASTASLK